MIVTRCNFTVQSENGSYSKVNSHTSACVSSSKAGNAAAYFELRNEDSGKMVIPLRRCIPVGCQFSSWKVELVHLFVAKVHKGIANGVNAQLWGLQTNDKLNAPGRDCFDGRCIKTHTTGYCLMASKTHTIGKARTNMKP